MLLDPFDIVRRIQNHIYVYENAAMKVPAFRLTYAENMKLIKQAVVYGIIDAEEKAELIREYMGCEIEIVVPLK